MAWTDKNRTEIYNETRIDFAALAEPVARILLGEPNRHLSTKSNLRFGSKGSLSLNLETGQWFHFEEGAGGGVLDLISREIGGDRANAMRWLADHGFVDGRAGASIAPRRPKAARKPKGQDPETKAKIALAARQWAEARPIEGTPGELYLRRRGIDRWPSAVRWCPAFKAHPNDRHPLPAILFPATDAAGAVVAVQAVRLTPEGRKIATRAKTSLGPVGSGFFRLLGRGPLHICEGAETAFSVWIATGAPVFATLGPIAARRIEAAPVPPAGLLVIAGDAAELGSAAARTLAKATAAALERGLSVRVALPDGAPGADWNDTLQAAGADHVRAAIASAPVQTPEAWGTATASAPAGTVFDARRRVADAFARWAATVPTFDPEAETPAPVLAVRVSTGLGKSFTARRAAVDLVRTLRAAGDPRAVAVAVPRHNLADEFAAELAEIAGGLAVAVYRGRAADDPEAEGEKMCRRSDEAAAVLKAGAEVERTLCRQGEDRCPFFATCGHQRQRQARADIWILPHATLWRTPPRMIEPAALIVDEDASGGAFGGFSGVPVRLSLDELGRVLDVSGDLDATADLAAYSDRIARALRAAGAGRIALDAIRAEGLTADDMAAARRLAYRAIRSPEIGPETPPELLAERLAKVAPGNRNALRRARLFGLVRTAIEASAETVPGIFCETIEGRDGERFAAVRLRWRNKIAAGWNVPTLLASATARPEVLGAIWPALGDVIEAEAAAPAVTVRQITNRAFGAATLCPPESAPESAQRHARNTRARLRRYIETRRAELAGPLLVIAQARVIELLRAEGLPEGVEIAHYNALSGLDRWRDVRGVILIGRTAPAPAAVEDMAEVLAGRTVQRLPGWYEARPAFLNMRGDGRGPAIERKGARGVAPTPGTDWHPDALAEAIRWQICEGELLQAIGRGRGVNRTADDPLQVDLLTSCPLPIAVDEAAPFETFEPSARDLLAARGVTVLDTSAKGAWAVVAAILPDVYETPDAARKADERSHGQNPIETLIGKCPRETATARVKLAGGRYAVPVAIRAKDEAEARALLARVAPGADLLDFVPPPDLPVDLDTIEPVALPRVGDVFARFAVGSAMRHAAIGDTLAKSRLGGAVDRFEFGATLRQAEGRRRVAQS